MHVRVTGPFDRANVVLADRPLLLGRDPHCEVVLEDPGVSGCHARLQRTPNGVEVVDLGSANGVYVDGRRVQHAIVGPGRVIRIGASDVTFDVRDSVHAPVHQTLSLAPLPPPMTAPGALPQARAKKKRSAGWLVLLLGLAGACLAGGALLTWRWVETRGGQVSPPPPASQVAATRPLPMPNAAASLAPLVFDRNPFEDP